MAVAQSPAESGCSIEGDSVRFPSVAKSPLADGTSTRFRNGSPLALFKGKRHFDCEATLTRQKGTANERVDKLIININKIINKIPEQKRECFEIGIVGVSESAESGVSFDPMNHKTWGKEELKDRWESYGRTPDALIHDPLIPDASIPIPEHDDALIVLSVVTKEQVPSHIDQKVYAEMLRERLSMYYTIETNNKYITMDRRIEENMKKGYAVYMYIAINESTSLLKQDKTRGRGEEDTPPPDAPKAKKSKLTKDKME